jgi:predicted PurR-regulated permease PerM
MGNFGFEDKDFYKMIEKFSGIKNNKILVNLLEGLYKKGYSIFRTYTNGFLDNALDFADNILAIFVIPVITYYFLCDAEKINNKIIFIFPIKWRKIIRKIGYDTDKILSKYIISQFLLCGIVSFLTFIILIGFKVKYPVLLSSINGIFNIIPYFGPLFGAMPAIVIAFVYSPKIAIYLTIALYVIQMLEGNIIAPKITGDSVDLHPIVVIIVLILGGKIGGIMGMILAIPLVVFIKIIYEDLNYYIY